MTTKKEIPTHWNDKPEWFKENDWLIENQEHKFVKRLGNVIHGIQMDINIKGPNDEPMDATKACFMGDEAADANKFQYSEALREMNTLTGDDLQKAEKVLSEFKTEFEVYLPTLE